MNEVDDVAFYKHQDLLLRPSTAKLVEVQLSIVTCFSASTVSTISVAVCFHGDAAAPPSSWTSA